MKTLFAAVFLFLSANAFGTRIEIKHMSGRLTDEVSQKNACAKAIEQLKRKITQTCTELEGTMTGEWKLEMNHTGYYQKKCVISGSGTCEVNI